MDRVRRKLPQLAGARAQGLDDKGSVELIPKAKARTEDADNPTRRSEIGRERREKTRQLLLASSARLVADRGTEGVTIDDFVKAAGVARGTFYNYFNSRDELIAELWQHLGKTPLQKIREAHAHEQDPAYRLTSGFRMVIRKAAADHPWGWLLFRITATDARLDENMRSFPLADIRAGLDSGRFTKGDPSILCDYFIGIGIMAVKAVLVDQRPADYAEQCAVLVLRGLGLSLRDAEAVAARPLPPQQI